MIRGSILQTFFSFDLRWNVFSGAQLIEKSGIFENGNLEPTTREHLSKAI